jgi:FlaA1/EpsC-like NDP-sugar epimerase
MPMLQRLLFTLSTLSKQQKLLIAMVTDAVILAAAMGLALEVMEDAGKEVTGEARWLLWTAPVVTLLLNGWLGVYNAMVRFLSMETVSIIFRALLASTLLMQGTMLILGLPWRFGLAMVLYFNIAVGSVLLVRLVYRSLYNLHRMKTGHKKVVIYGAGDAGKQIAAAFQLSDEFHPVAFVDDDVQLYHRQYQGIDIHSPSELGRIKEELDPDMVLLAIPSLSRSRRRAIIDELVPLGVEIKTLPPLGGLLRSSVSIGDIQDIELEDLLGRDPVPPRPDLIDACIRGKSVLVTGAGGSIGSELCRQILRHGARRLVLFEISEFNLYQIHSELTAGNGECEIVPLLGSVCDRERLDRVLARFRIDTVYHAAAYKHVPLVETNPFEGIRNNVFGTMHTAQAAAAAGVESFILISTDKAVRPTNIMGATKRIAELVVQWVASSQGCLTRVCMVRFGNVLGSSGSVVPLFTRQIQDGGPITVTHPEITRYFMTIPEAVELVIQAGAIGESGEVFLLDMGEPVRIADLARTMVRLSGLTVREVETPDGDIEIVYSGLRPGEKLFEELLIGENALPTQHPKIFKAREDSMLPEFLVEGVIECLTEACELYDLDIARETIIHTVEGYRDEGAGSDPLWEGSPDRPLRRTS